MIRPKAVLFDLGDTILESRHDPVAGINRLLEFIDDETIQPDVIQTLTRKLDEIAALRNDSAIEWPAASYNRLLFDMLGLPSRLTPEENAAEFLDAAIDFHPEPGIEDALDFLERHGIRRAIVSNAAFTGSVLEAQLRKNDLLDRFEFLISSCDYGIRKPHPLIFEAALVRLSLEPAEVLFVGDKLEFDVAGANAVGLCSVWYNRLGQDSSDTIPDHEVTSWQEFIELLDKA